VVFEGRFRLFLLLAAGSFTGLLWTCSLPQVDAGWLAWICLVPCLYLLLHCNLTIRETWLLGLSAGLTAGLGRVYWVAETLQNYGGLSAPLAYLTTFLLSAYIGSFPAIVFRLSAYFSTLHQRRLPWIIAAVWVLLDWILSWLFTGFPWAVLGYSQYQSTWILPIAAIGGVHSLSYILVAANAAIAQLLGRRRTMWALIALCAPFLAGSLAEHLMVLEQAQELSSLHVGIVQGSVEQGAKWQTVSLTQTTGRHLRLARQLDTTKVPLDLIVFPETAFPFRLDHPNYEIHRRWLAELSTESGASLLVGSLGSTSEHDDKGLFNRAYLISGDTIADFADKVHLVPFGEYLPLKWIFGYLDELTAESGAFDPGQLGHKVLKLPATAERDAVRFSVFICYESIFPTIARQQTLDGAEFLINTTNDGWFGTTSAPAQHLAMAVLRAVENGRPVVRAANTGISCFIDAKGGIHQPTQLFEQTAIQADVIPRRALTPYTRTGDLIFALSALLVAISAINDARRRRHAVDAELDDAQNELHNWSQAPVPLSHRVVLISGYASDASVWAPLLDHIKQSFVDVDDAVVAVDLRHDLAIADLSNHVARLTQSSDPRPLVLIGHSLGGLVAVQTAALLDSPDTRVIAVASPFGGTHWATIARWLGRECPITLSDLAVRSAATQELEKQMATTRVRSIRLHRDLLSSHPRRTTATTSFHPAIGVSPRARHTLVLQDPRVLRDLIASLRSA
jgi:apolipoprotein N-acyltransferase